MNYLPLSVAGDKRRRLLGFRGFDQGHVICLAPKCDRVGRCDDELGKVMSYLCMGLKGDGLLRAHGFPRIHHKASTTPPAARTRPTQVRNSSDPGVLSSRYPPCLKQRIMVRLPLFCLQRYASAFPRVPPLLASMVVLGPSEAELAQADNAEVGRPLNREEIVEVLLEAARQVRCQCIVLKGALQSLDCLFFLFPTTAHFVERLLPDQIVVPCSSVFASRRLTKSIWSASSFYRVYPQDHSNARLCVIDVLPMPCPESMRLAR